MRQYYIILIAVLLFIPFLIVGQSVDAQFEKGMDYWSELNYEKAIAAFDEVLARNPRYADAYYFRGASREQLEDYNGAYLDYKYLVNLQPDNAEAQLSYGLICYRLKFFDDASATFQKLISLPPGPTNRLFYELADSGNGVTNVFTAQGNVKGMYYYYLGQIKYAEGDYMAALAFYDSAIAYNPSRSSYYVNRGEAFAQLGNVSAYEKNLRKALAINPEDERANYLMGRIMEGANPEKAIDYYTESIASIPGNPAPYRQRGFKRMKSGDLKGAEKDFSVAIDLDSREPTSFINRGIVREKLHKYELAIEDYSAAIELAPSEPKGYLNRGNVLYKLREYENALNDYTVALFYQPDYTTALYQRGLAFYQLGNRPAACADLEKARTKNLKYVERAYSKICNIN